MTDYIEEQKNELEALESIYPEEITVLKEGPHAEFEISLTSQTEEDSGGTEESDEDGNELTIQLPKRNILLNHSQTVQTTDYNPYSLGASADNNFKIGETEYTYPDEVPVIEITDSENVDDEQINDLEKILSTQAEENLGMVMVFTLVSAVQEELTCMVERAKEKKKEEEERKKKAEEEIEMKKFEGTRVTIENFLAWKTKFDAAMAEIDKKRSQADPYAKKLSGKEVFMKDSSMMDSDVQFLQEEGEPVEVDESLFQDMEDLDLDAENLEIED